ncbi:AAA family ATPase [Pseudomonas sp. KSR10]|uniref:AAA family ATPase n=1 Tax=Pseudomonas sp. KSR10 TaxID=2916654 RepID=UPI001EF7DFB7|nr:AAA family ATPase [Pseudomonas sp. KSR10]MCG6539208.1 AAA family ATPase [Pseudomonas sp. KSR10]
MDGCIEKIESIKGMAIFKDFSWSASVRDEGNNVSTFKRLNIIYGRNYSGKTTLSRIIRSLEVGSISDKYLKPAFAVNFKNSPNASSANLSSHGRTIRVFNEDFIRENLRFIVDDSEDINSFAILGEDNAKIENEIRELELELGSEEEANSLNGVLFKSKLAHSKAEEDLNNKEKELESKLKDKSNKADTGIRHNKLFGDANYNINKIRADINIVNSESYSPISQDQVESHHKLLREVVKEAIPQSAIFNLKYASIASAAKETLEREIKASSPLQELMSDAALDLWVRTGRDLHRGKKDNCSFCGGTLPHDLWDKLDKHFNQESEKLRGSIGELLTLIDEERARVPALLKIRRSDFYANFHGELDQLETDFEASVLEYDKALAVIVDLLNNRKADIYTPISFIDKYSDDTLASIHGQYESLRTKSNDFAASLEEEQRSARTVLRLHEVYTFSNDIKYVDECVTIEQMQSNLATALSIKNQAVENKGVVDDRIKLLKTQLKDESKGAKKVNEYLNDFFGHDSLSLEAVETVGDELASHRFEVRRNGERAYHLSEGECSLIAFCYFIAKLDDYETRGSEPIIWIDDPICSLDSNHIFFIYSLINAEVVTPEQYLDGQELKIRERYSQLFISTHNLDFLKYLKRLPGANNKKVSQYFLINRQGESSEIRLMPGYLKEYVTEFNYLFSQIQLCASIKHVDDTNYTSFYNFGNNARKFFEIYLYYKYPNFGTTDEKLEKFFGANNLPIILTNRINNEYSHLAGVFERGATPTEVPEMQKAAIAILERIKLKDPDQYEALMESVGAKDPVAI